MKNKKQLHKVYTSLQKKRNAIKIRAFIMAGFLLAVNTFAWFVFITNGDGKINADVIAWDIAYIDEESQTELLDIELEDFNYKNYGISIEFADIDEKVYEESPFVKFYRWFCDVSVWEFFFFCYFWENLFTRAFSFNNILC